MLGHRDLRTNQHYAKIVGRKISDDMKALKSKLAEKEVQKSTDDKKKMKN